MEPVLNFYYRYWFRVEVEGIENVPTAGGALLASNHSGALPPDAPMIMQAIRNEHPNPRPLYMLGEHWFKGYPGVGMLANKIGLVAAHPANAHRLLHDEGRLVLVFPEGQKGTRKLFWQRYKLRRFGRGGFVKTAIRAGVPIVPVAVMGAEEAMPIFAHVPLLQRLTGLIYFPINHAFPHFGLLAGGDVPAGEVPHPVPRAGALRALRPRRGRRRRVRAAGRGRRPGPHPGRAQRDARPAPVGLVRIGSAPCGGERMRIRPRFQGERPARRCRCLDPGAGGRSRRWRCSLVAGGCGGDDEARSDERPPVPINISVNIGEKRITASPDKFGAGPITLLVANQSGASQTLTIDGPRLRRSVGPINPQDTATVQGHGRSPASYTVSADESAGLRAATLQVGPERPSAQNELLLP